MPPLDVAQTFPVEGSKVCRPYGAPRRLLYRRTDLGPEYVIAGVQFSTVDIVLMLSRYSGRCHCCGTEFSVGDPIAYVPKEDGVRDRGRAYCVDMHCCTRQKGYEHEC